MRIAAAVAAVLAVAAPAAVRAQSAPAAPWVQVGTDGERPVYANPATIRDDGGRRVITLWYVQTGGKPGWLMELGFDCVSAASEVEMRQIVVLRDGREASREVFEPGQRPTQPVDREGVKVREIACRMPAG